jgi:PAS domain S-box-containing protein
MQHLEHSRELVDEGMMIRTMEGRINSWDRGAAELYGWKEEEAIGKISHDLLRTQFPKPLEEIESELVRNGRWEGKLVHSTRDGARIVVRSLWTFESTGPSETVFEINSPAVDQDPSLQAQTTADARDFASRQSRQTSEASNRDNLLSKLAKIADFLLIAGSGFAFLLTIYVIYYYGLSGQRELLSIIPAMIYAVPAGILVLLLGALWWTPTNKINLAMVVIACTVSLYGAEIFLRLWDQASRPVWLMIDGLPQGEKQKSAMEIEKQFGVKFDIRDRMEVIADLQKNGVQAVPAMIPRIVLSTNGGKEIREPDDLPVGQDEHLKSAIMIQGKEVVPLGGVAHKTTVLCNESGEWITYVSDEHGFNNPAGIWQSRSIEVAALGDSFTQGYCVPSEKSFVGIIRGRYPATLNLGMAGNGPLSMLASLREYLPSFKPKVVLWFYFEGNDLPELQIENKSALLMQYLNAGFRQGLTPEQGEIDQALQAYIERAAAKETKRLAQRSQNSQWIAGTLELVKLGTLRNRLGLVYGKTPEEAVLTSAVQGSGMDLFREVLSKGKAQVEGWGGRFYFVYLPSWGRYANKPEIGVQERGRVLEIVRDLDIPIVDIHPVFASQDDPLNLFPFHGSDHYNEAGHRIVGAEIVKTISSAGLLDRMP